MLKLVLLILGSLVSETDAATKDEPKVCRALAMQGGGTRGAGGGTGRKQKQRGAGSAWAASLATAPAASRTGAGGAGTTTIISTQVAWRDLYQQRSAPISNYQPRGRRSTSNYQPPSAAGATAPPPAPTSTAPPPPPAQDSIGK